MKISEISNISTRNASNRVQTKYEKSGEAVPVTSGNAVKPSCNPALYAAYNGISFSGKKEEEKEKQRYLEFANNLEVCFRIGGFAEAVINASYEYKGGPDFEFIEDFCKVMGETHSIPYSIGDLPVRYYKLLEANPDKENEKKFKKTIEVLSSIMVFDAKYFERYANLVFNPVTKKYDVEAAKLLYKLARITYADEYDNMYPPERNSGKYRYDYDLRCIEEEKEIDYAEKRSIEATENYFKKYRNPETGEICKDAPDPHEYIKNYDK